MGSHPVEQVELLVDEAADVGQAVGAGAGDVQQDHGAEDGGLHGDWWGDARGEQGMLF